MEGKTQTDTEMQPAASFMNNDDDINEEQRKYNKGHDK